jgi:hypothetical protein
METPSWGSAFPGGVAPGSAEPQLGESFFLAACNAGGFSGFEMREVVGDFMETPSWGSAFPGGGGRLPVIYGRRLGGVAVLVRAW